jgi:non-specific serine/threonine protein kinase
MLETIRAFGQEQLAATGETETTMRCLVAWGLGLLEGAEHGFYSAMQWQWVERFEAEHDNLRSILAWAVDRGDGETAQALVEKLGWFWFPRGYLIEGRSWGERALALGDPSPTPGRALSLALTATIAWRQGDHRRARELATAGLGQSRQIGHLTAEGVSLLVLGWTAEDEGRLDEAEAYVTEALELYHSAGRPTWVGFALNSLGTIDFKRGDIGRAAIRFEEAHDILRAAGNTYGVGFVVSNMAKAAREQGDFARAGRLYAESLALRYEQGEKQSIAGGLRGLASVAAATRQYERAARLWGAAEALREAIGAQASRPLGRAQDAIGTTQRALGDAAFAAAWAAGRSLTLGDVMTEALQTAADMTDDGARPTPPTSADRYGLTPREIEVLRLIAAGQSNPAIAEALFISTRTAQTHVQNIFTKLGVNSRAEAVRLAVEHRLV